MGPDCHKAVFQSTCLDVIYDVIHNLGEFWVPALHFPETRPPLSAENSILAKLRQFPQHSVLKSDPFLIGLILTVILWKSLSPKRSALPGTAAGGAATEPSAVGHVHSVRDLLVTRAARSSPPIHLDL